MIAEFIASWPLFQWSYLAGWSAGVVLSLAGVVVVARDQIFLGAAVSQASTAGIAAALWLGTFGPGAALVVAGGACQAAVGVLFSALAAWVAGRGGQGRGESREAIAGWIFLSSSSLFILFLSQSAHGPEEVRSLLFSSLFAATPVDAVAFGVMGVATAVFLARFRDRILLMALDPPMAGAVGLRLRRWSLAGCLWLGLTLGLALSLSGLLYTFGFLVLPALIANELVREARQLFPAAAAIALAAAVPGFVVAHSWNIPLEPTAVALLCALLVAAWILRAARSRTARR